MFLTTADLSAALQGGRDDNDVNVKAQAENIAFDESVADVRRDFFESEGFGARGSQWHDLSRRQCDYIQKYIVTHVMPHTFDKAMVPASLGEIDEAQHVVRLETVTRPLENSGFPLDELMAAHAEGDADFLDEFLTLWNESRDARPAFATFKREVVEELAAADWPERLRDRLGLAHYNAASGPVPVALMSYPVSDVLAEAPSKDAFTVPTVLDSRPWEHFFPAPRELSCGRAMALTPCDGDETLVAEFLHSRISYRREHMLKIGQIATPASIPDIATLRELHLLAVQIASGREDFGT